MPVKQLENLQYNIPSLFNVSDHVIEIRSIKYKNDIHLDGNLFFFGAPEIQHSAVEFSITNSIGDDERTLILHFHAAQRTGKSKRWLIGMVTGTVL